MILSFKKQFRDPILKGSKIHTIREDPKARWNAGRKIHMATGVRTKYYNCFLEQQCISVQAIQIHHHDYRDVGGNYLIKVIVDGKELDDFQLEEIAENDGFKSLGDFFKWFNTDFQGRIIHWTDFKY